MDQQKISQILTILFYLLVLGAVLAYFLSPDRQWFYYLGFGAVGVRLITYILRHFL